MSQLLTKKYPPLRVEDIYPTTDIEYFKTMIMNNDYPSIMLFHGATGTGKTTLARIIAANILELDEEYTKILIQKGDLSGIPGYVEKDFTRDGRAEQIRDIADSMRNVSEIQLLNSKHVFVLDEFDHPSKDIQKMIVKPIDDISSKSLFLILITNNPHRIEETIRSRCIATEKEFKEVSEDTGTRIILDVAKKEQKNIDKNVATRLYRMSRHKTPRSIILQLQQYFDSGKIEVSADREFGLIRDYFVIINNITTLRVSKIEQKDAVNREVEKLYSISERLIYLKKSFSTLHLALCKYIESQMRSQIDMNRLKNAAAILNCLNDKSELEYSYPVAELMRINYNIINSLENIRKENNTK